MSADETLQAEIRERALALLARREHAPVELARKLHQRDYPADAVAAVLSALQDENLLSEARYAEALVRARIARGQGPLRIRAELARMAIDETIMQQAFAAAAPDWFALAAAVRRKRFGADLPTEYKLRAKQMRFLQRRGFDFDCIGAAFGDD